MIDIAATDPNPDDHQAALDDLVGLLDLEVIEVNMFRGVSTDENRQRVFGGQVAGQALVAAARTIEEPGRMVHSLHAYFLRPGDPKTPILYEVDRIRDGRSFTTRRVVAIQHGKAIFNLQASFHNEEPGPNHQVDMPTASLVLTRSPTSGHAWLLTPTRSGNGTTGRAQSMCATSTATQCLEKGTLLRRSKYGSAPTANFPTIRYCMHASLPTRAT